LEQVVVSDFGAFLGKHSERLVIKRKDKEDEEHALMNLDGIIVASPGVSISSDLISECTDRGIEINFLTFSGRPFAKVVSPSLTATVVTRREQLSAMGDVRGLKIALRFAGGKIRNQINLIKYFSKHRKTADVEAYARLMEKVNDMEAIEGELCEIKGENVDGARGSIMNLEGRAAALYWDSVKLIISDKGEFTKRKHRYADDAINAALNYGYGILYSQVWSALVLAGLEPFAGFLHVDRPGKPSLVLDFIEEFRQPVVDRVVLASITKGFKIEREKNVVENGGSGGIYRLSEKTRKSLADKVLGRLESEERFERKNRKIRNIIQLQANHLAMYFRGEREYKPFVASW